MGSSMKSNAESSAGVFLTPVGRVTCVYDLVFD